MYIIYIIYISWSWKILKNFFLLLFLFCFENTLFSLFHGIICLISAGCQHEFKKTREAALYKKAQEDAKSFSLSQS